MEGVLTQSASSAKKKGDTYLAADQILLHLVDTPAVGSAFRQAGLSPDKVCVYV